jgi:hypothetical protein
VRVGSCFAVLGVAVARPSHRRATTPSPRIAGRVSVARLAHALQSDASIRRPLIVNGVPLTVVGVGPEASTTTRGTRVACSCRSRCGPSGRALCRIRESHLLGTCSPGSDRA